MTFIVDALALYIYIVFSLVNNLVISLTSELFDCWYLGIARSRQACYPIYWIINVPRKTIALFCNKSVALERFNDFKIEAILELSPCDYRFLLVFVLLMYEPPY